MLKEYNNNNESLGMPTWASQPLVGFCFFSLTYHLISTKQSATSEIINLSHLQLSQRLLHINSTYFAQDIFHTCSTLSIALYLRLNSGVKRQSLKINGKCHNHEKDVDCD